MLELNVKAYILWSTLEQKADELFVINILAVEDNIREQSNK